jgi:hypothetical protein
VFVNDVVQEMEATNLGISVNGVWVGIVIFADDMLLMADTEEELHAMMQVVEAIAARWHYEISDNKSHVMVTSTTSRASNFQPEEPFTFNNTPVSVVDFIKYLGVELTSTGSWKMVSERLRLSARARFGMLACSGVNMYGYHAATGVRIYNTMVRPITDYCADVWTPDTTRRTALETFHNWGARTITGLEKWTAIPGLHADLGFHPCETRRNELKLRRLYRLHAMPDEWLVKKVYIIRRTDWLNGRRRLGGNPWMFTVAAIANLVGLGVALTHPDATFARLRVTGMSITLPAAAC